MRKVQELLKHRCFRKVGLLNFVRFTASVEHCALVACAVVLALSSYKTRSFSSQGALMGIKMHLYQLLCRSVQALVDRPDMVRRQINFKRLVLTDFKIDIPRLAKKKVLTAALEESGAPASCLHHLLQCGLPGVSKGGWKMSAPWRQLHSAAAAPEESDARLAACTLM